MLLLRGKKTWTFPVSKQTGMGSWSCHREQEVRGDCTVAQEAPDCDIDSPPYRRATCRAVSMSGGDASTARRSCSQQQSQLAGRGWRWSMHAWTRK